MYIGEFFEATKSTEYRSRDMSYRLKSDRQMDSEDRQKAIEAYGQANKGTDQMRERARAKVRQIERANWEKEKRSIRFQSRKARMSNFGQTKPLTLHTASSCRTPRCATPPRLTTLHVTSVCHSAPGHSTPYSDKPPHTKPRYTMLRFTTVCHAAVRPWCAALR